MTESMQEIFDKPLSIENICEKLEYWLDNEMTQELFNLSCEYEIGERLLSKLISYNSNNKRVQDIYFRYKLDDYYNNMMSKNHELITLKEGLYYVTTSLFYKIMRCESADRRTYDMTISDVRNLTNVNNEFIYKTDNNEQLNLLDSYEMFLRGRKFGEKL